MGAWRAFISRARARTANPFLSYPSLSKVEQLKLYLLDPIARLEIPSHDASSHVIERFWPGSVYLLPRTSQKEARQDAQTLFEDTKEFIQLIRKDLGRLDFGSSDHCFQGFGQRKDWLHGRVLGKEQETLALKAGDSVDIKNLFWQGTTFTSGYDCHSFSPACYTAVNVPGFHGSEDISIRADSVKRKRKKKMNKHKHRKLRRLARKSRK